MSKNTNWADAMRTDVSNPGPITKYLQRRRNPVLRRLDKTASYITITMHAIVSLGLAIWASIDAGINNGAATSIAAAGLFLVSIPFMLITMPLMQLVVKFFTVKPPKE